MNRILNKRDLVLMTHFRRNARENLTKISRLTRVPVSTIFDKLKQFETSLIKKHTTLIDFRVLGFDVRLNMLYKLSKNSRNDFREFLLKNENVNTIYRVNNGYDYLVEGIFKDMSDLQRFNEELDKYDIEAKQELFILEDIKREGFLSDDIHTQLLLN